MKTPKTGPLQWILWLLSLIIVGGLLRSVGGYVFRSDVVTEHKQVLESEIVRNRTLKARLQEATSAAFIEKQAREKLGLARKGDTIVLLQTPQPIQADRTATAKSSTNWKRWWHLFF